MKESLRLKLLPRGGNGLTGRVRRAALVCCLVVAAGGAAMASAQRLVTLELRNRPAREAMAAIERSSDYVFLFPDEVGSRLGRLVDVDVSEGEMTQALAQIFDGTGIAYRIVDRQVLLSLDRTQQQQPASATITGRVVDEDGYGLGGASVVVTNNTPTGTSTDADGRFSLTVPSSGGSLTVSFVGKETRIVALVAGRTDYTIELTSTSTEIGEVVTMGYFTRAKDNFTGSAVVVSGDELKRVNPNNLLQGIQSFDPSFRVGQSNLFGSDPNRLPNINVRGAASLPSGADDAVIRRDNIENDPNMPTFILDGYEVDVQKIYDLDINRVESVSLLKDAAATAIYGSRAANGVLVITTIAPKEGELRLSVNYELSPSFADLSSYDLLDAKEKLQYEVDAGLYDSAHMNNMNQQDLNEEYYKKYYNVLGGIDTDWLAQPVRNAVGHKASLYLEGGSETMRYGVNALFQTMPGVMKESGRDRIGGGVDLSYYAKSNLIFKNVLSVANVVGDNSRYGSFSDYVGMNPYFPKTDPETGRVIQDVYTWNDHFGDGNSGRQTHVLNPLWDAGRGTFSTEASWEISDSFTLDWTILPGLRLRTLLSYIHTDSSLDDFLSPYANYFFNETDNNKKGRYIYVDGKESNVDANATLTWGKTMGRHFLNTALGANILTENSKTKRFEAIGFTNDRFSEIGFAQGYADGAKPVSIVDKAHLFGTFLSVNYSYDNRFLADLSGRLDGSSRFGSNNNVAMFWAAGVGWNIHNEHFIADDSPLSRLRITANTGLTGSDSSNPYQAKTLYEYGKYRYSSGAGASVNQYGNENLRWERTLNTDAGIEAGFMEDRFLLTAHYYYKLTKDMLADIALPTSTGFNTYKANLGDVKNEGYEIGLRATVLRNDDWNVQLHANFTGNRNRVMKISDALKEVNDAVDNAQGWDGTEDPSVNPDGMNNIGVPLLRYAEGWAFDTIWAVRSLGIDPETGREIFLRADGTRTFDWHTDDIVPLRTPAPRGEGFFGGSVYYKGFMLNVSLYTKFGGYAYNETLSKRVDSADPYNNVDRRAREGRWTKPGDVSLYKNIRDRNKTNLTERLIQRDNALELRSVFLSYDFQPQVYEKLGMRSLRLSLTANDLWRTSTIELERGIDYPFARSLTFSLQTSF